MNPQSTNVSSVEIRGLTWDFCAIESRPVEIHNKCQELTREDIDEEEEDEGEDLYLSAMSES
eukprot:1769559-Karenia_brevis.AAC.1